MTRHEKSPSPAIFGMARFSEIALREIPVRADAVEKPVGEKELSLRLDGYMHTAQYTAFRVSSGVHMAPI